MSPLVDHGPATDAGADAALDATRIARRAMAERYFSEDLRDQCGWYSRKASGNKTWAQRLGMIVIGCGALIAFLQIFAGAPWVPYATGAVGVLVALTEGAQRIWTFDETWRGYRAASEGMKREHRLYINGAGDYTAITDEDAGYRAFVTAIEQIIAQEQQLYWKARDRAADAASPSEVRPTGGARAPEEQPSRTGEAT